MRNRRRTKSRVPEWAGDDEFVLDGARYLCHVKWGTEVALRPGQLRIIKTRALVERYVDLVSSSRPRNIIEVGLFKGGSTAFLAQLADPERLVAVDIREEPIAELEAFLDDHGLRSRVSVHYGVDQADVAKLEGILAQEFGGAPLDLVVDDASHRLAETRTTFHCLFPRLRPGGTYFLEDWSWAHNRTGVQLVPGPALSALAFELTLACAYAPEVVESVTLHKGSALVRRGPADLGSGTFDLAGLMDDLGRSMVGALSNDIPSGPSSPRSA